MGYTAHHSPLICFILINIMKKGPCHEARGQNLFTAYL